MPGFWDIAKGITGGGVFSKSARNGVKSLFGGTPEVRENVSTLRPEQEALYQQAIDAGMRPGAGGAFGQSADYYRDLLDDNGQNYNALAAPEQRRFNEQTVPDLAEQFAGMGSGGLSSSGFRNSAVNAGVDLSERLGAIRANLRNSGAQGLQNIGNIGLQNYSQNMVTQQGSPGLLAQAAPAAGTAIGAYLGGPSGAAAGNSFGNMAGNWLNNGSNAGNFSNPGNGGNKVGMNTGAYQGGNSIQASPSAANSGFKLPSFGYGGR